MLCSLLCVELAAGPQAKAQGNVIDIIAQPQQAVHWEQQPELWQQQGNQELSVELHHRMLMHLRLQLQQQCTTAVEPRSQLGLHDLQAASHISTGQGLPVYLKFEHTSSVPQQESRRESRVHVCGR
jgi:hypothetical protein